MQLWPSRGTSVILTPNTCISRQIRVTRLLVPRHSTISENPRWARNRTGCLQSRREEGKGAQWLHSLQHTLVHLLVPAEYGQALLLPVQCPKPCCEECHQPPLVQETGHPAVAGGSVVPRGIGLWAVPAARGPQRTHQGAFTVQAPAIRRNMQLEFKLDALCVHED